MLLYSSDDVYAVFNPGSSDYLLITFGYFGLKADDQNFWARGLCMKAAINAIGFTSRRTDWFPPSRMEACIEAVLPKIREFPRRLIYGGSMGGYAVMRYARALETDHAVAYVPQYSIDPNVVGDFDSNYAEIFDASLHAGMEPTGKTVPANGFVLYDRHHAIDNSHIQKYRAIAPMVEFIDVPNSGHSIGRLFAGTSAALDLFELALNHDNDGLRRRVRRQRRASALRPMQIAQKLLSGRPLWAALIFAKYGDTFLPDDRATMLTQMQDLNVSTRAEMERVVAERPPSREEAPDGSANAPELGKLRKILAATDAALAISGADSLALIREAKEAGRLGNGEQALEICRRAVSSSPRFPETHQALAILLIEAKDYDAAVDAAQRAVELDPDNPDFTRLLAAVHERRGDYAAAVQAAQRAVSAAPRDEKLRSFLEILIVRDKAKQRAEALKQGE